MAQLGPCGHTQSHRPGPVVVSLEFPTEKAAVRFEKYLKSGSAAHSPLGILDLRDYFQPAADSNRGRKLKTAQDLRPFSH
jgi:hypothetical protein